MPQVGPAEILVIFVIALLVFGPQRLPEVGKQVGRAFRELKKVQADFREELRDAFDADPVANTPLADAQPTDQDSPADPDSDGDPDHS